MSNFIKIDTNLTNSKAFFYDNYFNKVEIFYEDRDREHYAAHEIRNGAQIFLNINMIKEIVVAKKYLKVQIRLVDSNYDITFANNENLQEFLKENNIQSDYVYEDKNIDKYIKEESKEKKILPLQKEKAMIRINKEFNKIGFARLFEDNNKIDDKKKYYCFYDETGRLKERVMIYDENKTIKQKYFAAQDIISMELDDDHLNCKYYIIIDLYKDKRFVINFDCFSTRNNKFAELYLLRWAIFDYYLKDFSEIDLIIDVLDQYEWDDIRIFPEVIQAKKNDFQIDIYLSFNSIVLKNEEKENPEIYDLKAWNFKDITKFLIYLLKQMQQNEYKNIKNLNTDLTFKDK